MEWLLHALIGCMTTTVAYHAAAQGIEVRSISSAIDGDLDLRGFLGLSDKVRKGYAEIRVKMRVGTMAKPEVIEALTRMSPVLDVVSRSVPVKVTVLPERLPVFCTYMLAPMILFPGLPGAPPPMYQ